MRPEVPHNFNWANVWRVREPQFDERLLRAAVLERDGGNLWVSQFLDGFDADNPVARARLIRIEAKARERILRRHANGALRRASGTRPTRMVVTRDAQAQLPTFHIAEAIAGGAGALFAIAVSNNVLATYVVKSGSELYALDPTGARLFAVLPVLAALGIKAFERFLPTDTAKSRYAASFYVLGVATFLIWTAAAAITFAPDPSAAGLLTIGGNSRWTGIALVVSHILGDGAWGYVLFSSAEKLLLGPCKRIVLDNPDYPRAVEHARQAQAAHSECQREIGDIEDYLAAVVVARRHLQARAELEIDRVTALWQVAQQAGLAYARAHFLNAN